METEFFPKFTTPYLFDKVIGELQRALKNGLPWLENSYGRAERLVTEINERRLYVPAIYQADGQYGVMLPDDRLGCYSFFVLHEPQEVLNRVQTEVRIKSPFSLIVWVDMRRVEKTMRMPDERNTEYIKEQVLSVIETASKRKGHISINRIYQRAENVFDGFTLDEVKNQFLMSPYAGFRFYGEMIATNDCNQ